MRGGPAIEADRPRRAPVPRPWRRSCHAGGTASAAALSAGILAGTKPWNRCLGLCRPAPEGPERRGPRLVAPPASP